jgi:MoxR-like ATPase
MTHEDSALADWREQARRLEAQIGAVVVGQSRAVRLLTIALFARGHVLLEGDVGVGKTTLLRALARALGGAYERVEGTVDLMPADLVYHTYIDADGKPRVDPGPLLKNGDALCTFFFNEINRARPQVHATILRVMAERSVSAFNREWHLPHVLVFADRNRVEKEETFEIASAARDRFMLEIPVELPRDEHTLESLAFDTAFHDTDTLVQRVEPDVVRYLEIDRVARRIQASVQASAAFRRYALDVWQATRDPTRYGIVLPDVQMDELILAGASPRGMSMALRAARVRAWLEGRDHLVPEDLQFVLHEALGHRVFFTPIYELRRAELARAFIDALVAQVAAP